MKYIIILLIFSFAVSCGSKSDTEKKDSKKEDKTENKKQDDINNTGLKQSLNGLKDNQAIIEADPKMDYVFGKNYKNWTPSAADVETAEKLLYDCYQKEKTGTVNHFFGRTLEEYNRQFIGGINEAGDKIIWINCFCQKEEKNFTGWKSKIFSVADGGNCFFNLKINITKNTFYELMVNGDA